MNLEEFKQEIMPQFEQELTSLFAEKNRLSANLNSAMSYSTLNGGKRLRPLLLYATLAGFNQNLSLGHKSAMALELIHCYSLIHDDLPAMDNDTLRRGQPTCHIKFNEYTAILAGDALQTLAFEILAKADELSFEKRIYLIEILTKSAGADGMVGGQMLDMNADADTIQTYQQIAQIHKNKTGALIRASILMGAILADADKNTLEKLQEFAELIGFAFQIQDDILDITSTTAELGKKVAVDLEQNKASFVNVLGLEPARSQMQDFLVQAEKILADLEAKNAQQIQQNTKPNNLEKLDFSLLKQLALYIIKRRN